MVVTDHINLLIIQFVVGLLSKMFFFLILAVLFPVTDFRKIGWMPILLKYAAAVAVVVVAVVAAVVQKSILNKNNIVVATFHDKKVFPSHKSLIHKFLMKNY
jgi:hypothetical protein